MDRESRIKKSQQIMTFQLKQLLETKHLYQSTTIDLSMSLQLNEENRQWRLQAAREKWGVHDNATRRVDD